MKLKSCPFCGGPAFANKSEIRSVKDDCTYDRVVTKLIMVRCGICGANGPLKHGTDGKAARKAAVQGWNTREEEE